MRENVWYNVKVPKTSEKKNENFSLKMPVSLMQALTEIAESEDRPLGYVGRELMLRGLRLYRQDGRLRDVNGDAVAEPLNGIPLAPTGSKIQLGNAQNTQTQKRRTR